MPKARANDYEVSLSFLCEFFDSVHSLNARLEYSRSNLVFEILDNFIFGVFCWYPVFSFSADFQIGLPDSRIDISTISE